MSTAPAPTPTQIAPDPAAKATAFRALHESGCFVIANAWDIASVRMLTESGFAALATSSAAAAEVIGLRDGQLTREQTIAHVRLIASATSLPVHADLGDGFGPTPEDCALTIRLAAEAGAVSGSIEDSSGDAAAPIRDFDASVARVEAAVRAARALPFAFSVTARAENFLHGVKDLDDTIRRLQAYERAGADALFAPLLPDLDAVERVCRSVSKPVNFMAGVPGLSFTVPELAARGVRRVSLAMSLFRYAMRAAKAAALEVKDEGSFGYLSRP